MKRTEDYARVRGLLDGTRTVPEIAAEVGLSEGAVYAVAAMSGLPYRHSLRRGAATSPLTVDDRTNRDAAIVARVVAGETYGAVGADFGLTRERVRQIVRAAGVEEAPTMSVVRRRVRQETERTRQDARASKRAARAAQEDHVRELVKGGMSIIKAADVVGLSRGKTERIPGLGALSRHGRWRKDLPERAARIVEMFNFGMEVPSIALALGIPAPHVYNTLNARGIRVRGTTAREETDNADQTA